MSSYDVSRGPLRRQQLAKGRESATSAPRSASEKLSGQRRAAHRCQKGASSFHPCPCCSGSADELCKVGAASVVSGPRTSKTFENYNRACADCEFKVVVNSRTLSVALPSLGLLKSDRLEPSGNLMDVGQLESVTTFTLWHTFWRQAIARNRNPLFPRETHISPCSIALESLHCLHFGVYKDYCMTVLWKCILADAWKLGTSTQNELVQMSVLHCK